jgi:hypothetical protein
MPFSFANPVYAPRTYVFESPHHDDLSVDQPPAYDLPPPASRNKRKSPTDVDECCSLPSDKSALSARARELVLTQIAAQTGLPRICLQLHASPEDTDGVDGSTQRLRVQIRCNAMLQPHNEWTSHQTWLRRQEELGGDDVAKLAESHAREPARVRSSIRRDPRAGSAPRRCTKRTVVFEMRAPQCMDVPDAHDGFESIARSTIHVDALETNAIPLRSPGCCSRKLVDHQTMSDSESETAVQR